MFVIPYQKITSELILQLMNGQAIIHVDSGAGNVSGQVKVLLLFS